MQKNQTNGFEFDFEKENQFADDCENLCRMWKLIIGAIREGWGGLGSPSPLWPRGPALNIEYLFDLNLFFSKNSLKSGLEMRL